MARRRAVDTVVIKTVVLLEGPDELKARAEKLGMRAIRYSDGFIRIREPRGFHDFPTEKDAAEYLRTR